MNAVAIEEHPTDIEVGYWWACQHPERPAEGFTAWLWECDPCMIAMAAYVAQEPDGPGTTCRDGMEMFMAAQDAFAEAQQWRIDNGIPPVPSRSGTTTDRQAGGGDGG